MKIRIKNNRLAPITFSEDKPRTIEFKLNQPPKKQGFWARHETQIFNGIQRGLEYIAAGSVIAWLLYWIPIWASK